MIKDFSIEMVVREIHVERHVLVEIILVAIISPASNVILHMKKSIVKLNETNVVLTFALHTINVKRTIYSTMRSLM